VEQGRQLGPLQAGPGGHRLHGLQARRRPGQGDRCDARGRQQGQGLGAGRQADRGGKGRNNVVASAAP
jgi:hypothetical protein